MPSAGLSTRGAEMSTEPAFSSGDPTVDAADGERVGGESGNLQHPSKCLIKDEAVREEVRAEIVSRRCVCPGLRDEAKTLQRSTRGRRRRAVSQLLPTDQSPPVPLIHTSSCPNARCWTKATIASDHVTATASWRDLQPRGRGSNSFNIREASTETGICHRLPDVRETARHSPQPERFESGKQESRRRFAKLARVFCEN